MFCETRTSPTDHSDFYCIDDFNTELFHTVSKNAHRSHYGLALYSKQPISYTEQPITLSQQCSSKTAECFFTVVAIHPHLVLTVACVYRRPNTDLTHFRQRCHMSSNHQWIQPAHGRGGLDRSTESVLQLQHEIETMVDLTVFPLHRHYCCQCLSTVLTLLSPEYTPTNEVPTKGPADLPLRTHRQSRQPLHLP